MADACHLVMGPGFTECLKPLVFFLSFERSTGLQVPKNFFPIWIQHLQMLLHPAHYLVDKLDNRKALLCGPITIADPGGPWGPTTPPCPQDFFKIMQFSGNFKGKPLFWTHFGLKPPLEVKTQLGPPDQNPGSAPVLVTPIAGIQDNTQP